jgi:tRNA 2-thiouridine synthesizing protein E
MPDIVSIIEDLYRSGSPRIYRETGLEDWSEEQGQCIAEDAGINLTDAHWEVVYRMCDYCLEFGPPESAGEIGDMLDGAFTDRGGGKYWRRLFTGDPVALVMRIAGLPLPPPAGCAAFNAGRRPQPRVTDDQ